MSLSYLDLPRRPPIPSIQVTSPVPSVSSEYMATPSIPTTSYCEFDPTVYRENVMRSLAYCNYYRPNFDYRLVLQNYDIQHYYPYDQTNINNYNSYSYQNNNNYYNQYPQKNLAGFTVDLPSPILHTMTTTPHRQRSLPDGCTLAALSIASITVFLIMTYVYLYGFVRL